MCYLHLLIRLISSNKYQRLAKHLVPPLKGTIQVKLYFQETLIKIQTKEERLNFVKVSKTRSREKFYFRGEENS